MSMELRKQMEHARTNLAQRDRYQRTMLDTSPVSIRDSFHRESVRIWRDIKRAERWLESCNE